MEAIKELNVDSGTRGDYWRCQCCGDAWSFKAERSQSRRRGESCWCDDRDPVCPRCGSGILAQIRDIHVLRQNDFIEQIIDYAEVNNNAVVSIKALRQAGLRVLGRPNSRVENEFVRRCFDVMVEFGLAKLTGSPDCVEVQN